VVHGGVVAEVGIEINKNTNVLLYLITWMEVGRNGGLIGGRGRG
jgi:hypothetical protein